MTKSLFALGATHTIMILFLFLIPSGFFSGLRNCLQLPTSPTQSQQWPSAGQRRRKLTYRLGIPWRPDRSERACWRIVDFCRGDGDGVKM